MAYSTESEIKRIFQLQQSYAPKIKKTTAKERAEKLTSILAYIKNPSNRKDLIAAVRNDMMRPEVEIIGGEIVTLELGIKDMVANLEHWLKPKKVATPLSLQGATSYIKYEPKGNCLIISPWNYPFQLAITPLIYCIAAGNTAVIKPSEYSENTSIFLDKMISELFQEEEIKVIQGEISQSTTLLGLPFNHIYFTGSPTVGKIVMTAAAKNLASVTLELGGKSPCIVDETANIKKSAASIMWGKCYNSGQTCIAPDYLLVHKKVAPELKKELISILNKRFNPGNKGMKNSKDLGRIISARHFLRAKSLIEDAIQKGAKVLMGGDTDNAQRFVAPTLLENVTKDMKIMQEEIFCPIFPIIEYNSLGDIIKQISSLPKPLAFYIFSSKQKNIDELLDISTAGGTVINDTLIHYANENLPFGGVNNSGIGKSHGKYGLYSFMNERAVMHQKFGGTALLHPPYSDKTMTILNLMSKL